MATLIEKLEKWREERRVAEESKAVQKTEQLEALRHRAKELELYLQRVGVQQVGFKMTSARDRSFFSMNFPIKTSSLTWVPRITLYGLRSVAATAVLRRP